MSAEDLEKYETEMELTLYREYRDVVGIFKYVVETDRRFYLCNQVDVKARTEAGEVFFEVSMSDAWVWDMYRPPFSLLPSLLVWVTPQARDLPALAAMGVTALTAHYSVFR